MWTSSTAKQNFNLLHKEMNSFFSERILSTAAENLKRAINNNPEMALAISASLGVLLGCLTKRR